MIAGTRVLDPAGLRAWDGPDLVTFVGVTTGGSRIHDVFPAWAAVLGKRWVLRGLDLPPDTSAPRYRELVMAHCGPPGIAGAVVTSHKLRLFDACTDLLTSVDPLVALTHEVSCLRTDDGQAHGFAGDPRALMPVLAELPGQPRHGHVLCLGAGGAATAILIAHCLDVPATLAASRPVARRPVGHHPVGTAAVDATRQAERSVPPKRLVFTDVDDAALTALRAAAARCGEVVPEIEYHHTADPRDLLASLPPGSLVVNATGLGKDRPGSPLPDNAGFPPDALAWDLNYRGDLTFLRQGRQAGVATADGWSYFVAGWGTTLALIAGELFTPELLAELTRVALPFRP